MYRVKIIFVFSILHVIAPSMVTSYYENKHHCTRFTYCNYLTFDDSQKKCTVQQPPIHYTPAAKALDDWSFADHQLLSLVFPIEKNEKNFVRRNIRNVLFSRVSPTPFSSHVKLAAYSEEVLDQLLHMDPAITRDSDFVDFIAGNSVLRGLKPLAHRYGGHQFGYWADQLGDGRAHMLGEYVNPVSGERWELQLKGSGKTPYSRDGDGRAVIRSSVREFLASEAMHYLGVPTSRAATLVVSKDRVMRDPFYNGQPQMERTAVVLRLAPSWFRIGSFEILSHKGEIDNLRLLTDFVIEHYFPDIDLHDPDRILAFYSRVVESTALLMAKWQGYGFAHGVCNTDNFSILSLTIDYGPFRFMDEYNPDMVPNTSDDEARYAFRKQPDVGHFNLEKLKIALSPLLNQNQQKTMNQILRGYKSIYENEFLIIFRKKLGIIKSADRETDESLIDLLLRMMRETEADYTMTFRHLGDWPLSDIKDGTVSKNLWSLYKFSKHDWFDHWRKMYLKQLETSRITDSQRQSTMHSANPRYVLRNWMAQEVIAQTEKDNFDMLRKLHRILKDPFTENQEAELLGYADPPPSWASNIKVSCSS